MKTLCLLRHAKSSWGDSSLDDFDRPLADRGRRAAARMAAYLLKAGPRPDVVLCSPARRAVETWEPVADLLGASGQVRFEPDLYLASPGLVLNRIRAQPGGVAIAMVVGHNPTMEELAHHLCGGGDAQGLARLERKYPTGTLAVITFAADRWNALGPGAGYLDRFVRPKDLG